MQIEAKHAEKPPQKNGWMALATSLTIALGEACDLLLTLGLLGVCAGGAGAVSTAVATS